MNHVANAVHPALIRYSRGKITAGEAADLLGPDATIHDVVFGMRQAGLEPPRAPRDVEQAQVEAALRMIRAARGEPG